MNPLLASGLTPHIGELVGASRQAAAAAIDAAGQMEELFASMLVKEMRSAAGEGGLFAGDSADVLGGLFDASMGRIVAAGGALGLGALVDSAPVAGPRE